MHESVKENSKDVADNTNPDPPQLSSNEIENSLIENQNSLNSSSHLVREGIIAGKRIAKISVITLLIIGIVEIVTGYLSGSVVATADGIDSISDATISFIVLLGLRIAHRPADKKFHFGYVSFFFAAGDKSRLRLILGAVSVPNTSSFAKRHRSVGNTGTLVFFSKQA